MKLLGHFVLFPIALLLGKLISSLQTAYASSQNCNGTHPDLPSFEQVDTCGGNIVARSGRIEYFVNQVRPRPERCFWILRANRQNALEMRVTGSGLAAGQYISIVTIDTLSTSVAPHANYIRPGEVNWLTIGHPVVQIIFSSDSPSARGFTLEFSGIGNQVPPQIQYYHYDLPWSQSTGFIKFPVEGCGATYPPNSIVTIANKHPTWDQDTNLPKVHMWFDKMVFGDTTDMFKTYYSDQNQVWVYLTTCCNPISDNYEGAWLSTALSLITFKSGSSIEADGFAFHWTVSNSTQPPLPPTSTTTPAPTTTSPPRDSLHFTLFARELPNTPNTFASVRYTLRNGTWVSAGVTEAQYQNPNPNWAAEFDIEFGQGSGQLLMVEIWDADSGSHDFGTAIQILDTCNSGLCQAGLDNGRGYVGIRFDQAYN